MIEIERQICEAPDICAICQYYDGRAHLVRFETESGEIIAYPGQDEFREICDRFYEEIAAALGDCIDEGRAKSVLEM